MHLSRYVKKYPYPEKLGHLLLYSTKKASTILIGEALMRSIEDGTLSEKETETLSRLGFLVPDLDEEREQMLNMYKDYNTKIKRLDAIAVMNLDCNLACPYCFEEGVKGKYYMSPEMADLLVDYLERGALSRGIPVHMDFYGGEPLLSHETIKHISKRLKASAEEKGLEYSFLMVTNGTLLTRKRAEELVPLGFKGAKITIDGPKEIHDRSRPFKSGSGTFDTIIENIKAVHDIVSIQIGGNYTQENYREFPRLLGLLLEKGLTPDRLKTVMFSPVTNTGKRFGLPDFSEWCSCVNEPWLSGASLFLREEILKRGFRTIRMRPTSCMIELEDQIIVNHDGGMYKCPGFIGRKGFEVGHIATGIKDFRESHNLDCWKKDECLDCAYLPLCFGGCRYMKFLRDGKIDDVDCQKSFLDATLETCIRQDFTYKQKP